jgi:hypothetical protein
MMHIQLTPESAQVLSRQWRKEDAPFLAQRRAVAALALVASGAMAVIALCQLGIIKHLPEPPGRLFNSERIDASDEAYSRLSTPDVALAFTNYSVTLVLAAMGGRARAREAPWIPLALTAEVGFDVAQGLRLSVQQWKTFRCFCFWCLLAAGSSFATLPLVLGETRVALGSLLSHVR